MTNLFPQDLVMREHLLRYYSRKYLISICESKHLGGRQGPLHIRKRGILSYSAVMFLKRIRVARVGGTSEQEISIDASAFFPLICRFKTPPV